MNSKVTAAKCPTRSMLSRIAVVQQDIEIKKTSAIAPARSATSQNEKSKGISVHKVLQNVTKFLFISNIQDFAKLNKSASPLLKDLFL